MNRDKRENEHTHTHTHTFTYAHAVSVTHPHTRTPSHCAAPSHTYTHTPSHVCAEAERCLLRRLFLCLSLSLSLKHTHGHTLCSWTQQNQTGLLSPTSGDSRMSSGGTASTVRHGYLPAPPPPPLFPFTSSPLPPSLSVSLHSFIPHSPSCEAACVAEGHSAGLCCGVVRCRESWRARSDRGDR